MSPTRLAAMEKLEFDLCMKLFPQGEKPLKPADNVKHASRMLTIKKALQRARADAFREAVNAVCMYCGGRAFGFERDVSGPNAAGNYVHCHPSRSAVHEDVLCKATAIWSVIRYEQAQRAEAP